jgi:hypothetical protein
MPEPSTDKTKRGEATAAPLTRAEKSRRPASAARADKSKQAEAATEYPLTTIAVVAPIVGWLIPGGGHILLKRYVRGALLFMSVVAMFLIGLGLNGRVYKPNGGDILDILGFIGDVGTGGLYILARIMDWGSALSANAAADYGKTFIIVAGLLNFIAAADAHHIALGKKP